MEKNQEKQQHKTQETTPPSTQDRIFELEKQLDQMREFVRANEQHSNESEDLKNKVEHFKKEIKKITIELIQLRLNYSDEEAIR